MPGIHCYTSNCCPNQINKFMRLNWKSYVTQHSPLNMGRRVPKLRKQAMPKPMTAASPGAQISWRNVFVRASSPSKSSSQVDGIFIVLDVLFWCSMQSDKKLTVKCQQWHYHWLKPILIWDQFLLDYFECLWIWIAGGAENS